MISPLGQRQMFQTINAEAVKAAGELGGLLQRETGQNQGVLDRMAEAQASVPEIPVAEGLKAEERKEGRQHGGRQRPRRQDGEADGQGADTEPAIPADGHMDFLA